MLSVMRRRRSRDSQGFTVIELTVAMSIFLIVLAVAASLLLSLMRTATTGEALVANEQTVSFAITQLGRDLRSANPLIALGSTPAYSQEVEMQEVNPSSGATSTVTWTLSGGTLKRSVTKGGVTSTGTVLANVNTAGQTTFTYYDRNGADMVGAGDLPQSIATCTTRVRVTLNGAADPGPTPFHEQQDIQLRNQLANLAATGNNPC